ncbi:hypothetical protein HJC23_001889 [Cyclotella cryptica]|uniref:Kringle domain-containing protein n=1 Tax=Cyclotella cryptica TaxID=29204 RepID=A0ABD3PKZ5_9STRA|eukprot:CCRYP_013692-RA/>CCRYP_013692-RA protein AED:0.02 eAED:0.02 QI:485/1/1/1/1/1/2/289/421
MMCGCNDIRQTDYRGRFSVTQSGFQCREWSMAANYPNQGLDDGPYCRNPNGVASRAWCFVENADVLWDYCNVPMCSTDSSSSSGTSAITSGCINTARYDAIYADIEAIKNSIGNDVDRSHFLGGIVRMVAHDFMDYDATNKRKPLGQDGCLIFDSPMNVGLSSIWCDSCPLKQLYDAKYSDLSRADFWVAAGNAVIYLTSVNNELDLRNTYYWGRTTVDSCPGSDSRLPTTAGCQSVEGVFLERMGLTWKDAVALLGAHTLGRGSSQFSGHHGTWVPNDKEAQIFDKKYFEELFRRAWSPRGVGTSDQDWTTGSPNSSSPKMMLNTDMCLLFDIDTNKQCCSRTSMFKPNGQNRCESNEDVECPMYSRDNPRIEAAKAVKNFLGGSAPNSNNAPFYNAFTIAWFKATTNGLDALKPLTDTC